jgi:hypothetical protein
MAEDQFPQSYMSTAEGVTIQHNTTQHRKNGDEVDGSPNMKSSTGLTCPSYHLDPGKQALMKTMLPLPIHLPSSCSAVKGIDAIL